MKFLYFNADWVILLFLFFLFISKHLSQHIIFSYPYDKAENNIFYTYIIMFQGIDRNAFKETGDFEFSIELNQTHSISVNMEFTKIMTNKIDIYTNLHKHILVFSPYFPILLFDINVTHYINKEIHNIYTGFFDYQIFYVLIEEKYIKNEEKNKINLTVYLKDRPKFRFIYEDDIPVDLDQIINNYFNKEFGNKYFPKLTVLLKMHLDNAYEKVYQENPPVTITTAPFLFRRSMSINLSTFTYFSQDITGKRERVLFYYSGNIGNIVDYSSYNDHSDSRYFIENFKGLHKDKLQIFFNYQIINEIIQNFKKNDIIFMLNSTNMPFQDIKMNIGYLKTFIDQISFKYSSNTEFYINSTIKEVNLVKSSNGIAILENNIFVKGENNSILTFNTTLYLSINYHDAYSAVNLCVGLKNITIDFITARYKILEIDKFQHEAKRWIIALFDGKEQCIFKDDINLFANIKFIEGKTAGKNGLFILGEASE